MPESAYKYVVVTINDIGDETAVCHGWKCKNCPNCAKNAYIEQIRMMFLMNRTASGAGIPGVRYYKVFSSYLGKRLLPLTTA